MNIIKSINGDTALEGPIGIFDSGLGGLTVLKQLKKILPDEDIIYFGDTARVPYGPKSVKTIQLYATEIVNFLKSKNVKFIVVACNTATALALDFLKKNFKEIPIIGVIDPAVNKAIKVTKNLKLGIVGTKGTIKSGIYKQKITVLNPETTVISKACPLLVPFVEENLINHPALELILKDYLEIFKTKNIDTLILGCTHYPMLKSIINNFFLKNIELIDSAVETALLVKQIIFKRGLANYSAKPGWTQFYLSDITDDFIPIGNNFLGSPIHHFKQIDLAEYLK